MNRRVSLVAVVASAACFSTLGILTQLAYRQGALPLPLLAWRFALVSLLMAAYQLVRNASALRAGVRDLGKYAALSLTGYGAASVCYFFALKFATASVVAVLLYTYPAMVAALSSMLLGERLTRARVVAILLTFVGCAMVVGLFSDDVHASAVGIMLGLGAALAYSVFNLLSYRWMGDKSRMVLMTYTFGISAVALCVLTLATGGSLAVTGWTPTLWGLLGLIVLVPTFIAVLLYLNGIRRLGPAQAAIVSTTEPLFTIMLAAFVLGERLVGLQLVGAAFVVAGVVAAEWRTGEKPAVRTDELAAV